MSTTANILIRAKDKASEVMNNVSDSGGKMGSVIKGWAGPLIAAGAAFLTVRKAIDIATESLAAFAVQEKAVDDLARAIESFDGAIGNSMDDLMQFTSELQVLTNVGDEVTLQMMATARASGVATENLAEVTKASVALSKITGAGLNESLRKVNESMNGNINAMGKAFPAIKNMTDEQEKMAYVNDALAKSFETAKVGTETYGGALQAMQNSLGDMYEVIGEKLAPVFRQFFEFMSKAIPVFATSLGKMMEAVGGSFGDFGEILEWAKGAFLDFMAVTETVIVNAYDVWQLMGNQIALAVVTMVNDISYELTVRLPNILVAVYEGLREWANQFAEVIKGIGRIFENIKSGNFAGASAAFATMGMDSADAFSEGFERVMDGMPERTTTAMEKSLMEEGDRLANKIGSYYAERRAEMEEQFGFGDALDMNFGGLTFDEKKTGGAGKSGNVQLAAVESRLMTGGGSAADMETKMVNIAETALAVAETTNEWLKKIWQKDETQITTITARG